ncbi:hypothetical protein BT67DRAFT_162495 [Trichocladium antarcticum]|uniref:Uncharacterized protein n=1 Tax=Trichocladium antarcticum TaxID=1450529 RepID=A0AAN6UEE7_9PEZI|nr:hypothetical protein BT67DRAFT_162495 [Trichocladium antarcticum]
MAAAVGLVGPSILRWGVVGARQLHTLGNRHTVLYSTGLSLLRGQRVARAVRGFGEWGSERGTGISINKGSHGPREFNMGCIGTRRDEIACTVPSVQPGLCVRQHHQDSKTNLHDTVVFPLDQACQDSSCWADSTLQFVRGSSALVPCLRWFGVWHQMTAHQPDGPSMTGHRPNFGRQLDTQA